MSVIGTVLVVVDAGVLTGSVRIAVRVRGAIEGEIVLNIKWEWSGREETSHP
jgi:hypothetical protein